MAHTSPKIPSALVRHPIRRAALSDALQCGEKPPEVGGERPEIVHIIERRGHAGPGADRPRTGKFIRGDTHGERLGNRQREMRRKVRQPLPLFLDLGHVASTARKADRHVVTEPVGRVVPPVDLHRRDLKVRPVGELRGNEATDQFGGDVGLFHLRVFADYPRNARHALLSPSAMKTTPATVRIVTKVSGRANRPRSVPAASAYDP